MAVPRHFLATGSTGARLPVAAPGESTSVVHSAAGVGLTIPERRSDCSGQRPAWYPFQVNVCDAELDPADPDLTPRQMTTDPTLWEG